MPYVGNPVGGPKHKPQWAKDEDARIKASLDRHVESDAMQWKLLQAFLDRKVRSFITLSTVSISFNTRLEAEQFHKLMRSHRGKK